MGAAKCDLRQIQADLDRIPVRLMPPAEWRHLAGSDLARVQFAQTAPGTRTRWAMHGKIGPVTPRGKAGITAVVELDPELIRGGLG
jgi:hypothetical protein